MGSENGYKRSCEGTNSRGEPCKSPPLKGTAYCLSHSAKDRESVGFTARNGKQGRKRKPRATDVLRQRVETEIDDWLRPFVDGLRANRAVVVGTGPKARLEMTPDHPTRIRAAEAVLDRVYGKPSQTHDVTLREESEVDQAIRELLKEADGVSGRAA